MSDDPEFIEYQSKLKELESLAASPNLETRAEALEGIALTQYEAEWVTAGDTLPYLYAALELSSGLGESRKSELGMLHHMLAMTHNMLDHDNEALEHGVEALRIAREQLMPVYVTELTGTLGRIERRRGNYVVALDYFAQAYESATDSSSGPEFWPALSALMVSCQILGAMDEFDAALEKAEEAHAYAQNANSQMGMADALNEKAWLLYRLGAADEIPAVLERAEAHADTIANPWSSEFLEINQIAYQLLTEPNEGTLARLNKLRDSARERFNSAAAIAVINYLRAQYFAAVGDVDQALKLMRQVEILRETDSFQRFSLHSLHMQAAQIALGDGRHEQGAELLRKAIASYSEQDDIARIAELRLWLAEIEFQAGLTDAALADLTSVPRDAWQVNEAGWMRQSRLLAKTLGSLQRHTESLMVANEILSALYSSDSTEPAQSIAAEMHELKARSLAAIGEAERARSEFEQARDAYAGADDYASMARMAKLLKATAEPQVAPMIEGLL